MSDTTRIRIDLPKLDDLQQHGVLAAIKEALSRVTLPQCDLDAAIKLREMASETQIEEAREIGIVDDGELEVDDDAEISVGQDDGYYISAWLWVARGSLLVTAERIHDLYGEEGFELPSHMEIPLTLPEEYVTGALAYLEEQYGKDAHITRADLTDYMHDYAITQEEQA